MKKLAILVCVILAGCASTKPEVRFQTVEVKVPVMVPVPAPAETTRPDLVIYTLSPADEKDPGKVAIAYKASIKQLQGYILQLEQIVDGYRKLSKDQTNEGK